MVCYKHIVIYYSIIDEYSVPIYQRCYKSDRYAFAKYTPNVNNRDRVKFPDTTKTTPQG